MNHNDTFLNNGLKYQVMNNGLFLSNNMHFWVALFQLESLYLKERSVQNFKEKVLKFSAPKKVLLSEK